MLRQLLPFTRVRIVFRPFHILIHSPLPLQKRIFITVLQLFALRTSVIKGIPSPYGAPVR